MAKKFDRLAAAGIALLCGASVLTGVGLLAGTPEPTIHVEGMRLQNVLNGDGTTSIQALVDVYASDIETLTAGSIVLKYNSKYWQPSRMADNTVYSASVTESTFFETNPDLYAGTIDPFLFENQNIRTEVDVMGETLVLGFNLKSPSALPDLPGDKIEVYSNAAAGTVGGRTYLAINAKDKLKLGTFSFWVDPGALEEMTTKALPPQNEKWITMATLAAGQNDIMHPTQKTPGLTSSVQTPWTISYLNKDDPDDIHNEQYDTAGAPISHFHTKYEIPDVIVKVEAAEKEVEINAYQAYTDATPADIAASLQRYSSAVRLTYPNGDLRDEAMFWGNDVMTIEDNNSGRIYEFKYDAFAPNGYTFVEVDATGAVLPNPDPEGDYDPTHGDYTVKQYYTYVEDLVTKVYPTPVTVHLVVTPVKVIGITADNLEKSYKISDPLLPDDCVKLELPRDGRLVFDTVLSGTIPTMPLTTWTNGTNTLPVSSMNLLEGSNGGPIPVNWPASVPVPPADIAAGTGVGSYDFTCADPTQAAIQAAHPWATVDDSYVVEAVRTIKPDTASDREYIAEAVVDNTTGIQTITVRNRDGVTPLLGSSTFEVYRPDGVKVEPSWFASTSLPTSLGGAHTARPNNAGMEFLIYTDPGDTTSGAYPNSTAERETCRRHINLGGYFTVVVTEGVYGRSDPIRVYQPRRQNAYLYNYTVDEASASTGGLVDPNRMEFDFTGHKAGLYPFHLSSVLPNTVVLPLDCGYTVHTRYDGVTGAEPGEVRTFTVGSWTAAAAPSGKTAPNWTSGDIVTYGPSQFSDHSYGGGFGLVENPLNREAKVKVEPDDETTLPIESLRLTYEGAPAPSNILELTNGEVGTVAFDTQKEGYPYKQEFELTLTNDGTTDIHGIYIDALLGPSLKNPPEGQHFEIVKPPATDLAPGASTTFIITYILGLEKGLYVDDIYIGTSGGLTKTFIARFKVVDGTLYKLTVQPRPEDGSMGNGGAVVGVDGGIYDPTPVGSYLEETDPVWIKVKPLDEYAIKELTPGVPEVYYWDNGTKVYLTPYIPSGTGDQPGLGEQLFYFPGGMPPHDLTIYVDFYEPIPSKLRLSDLTAYADETSASCITPPNQQIMYDLTDTTYGTTGFTQDHTDYLVVIPVDADYSGLKLTLYDIVVPNEVIGPPCVANTIIQPDVHIQLDDPGATVVLDEKGWVGSTHAVPPATPTDHSTVFKSPDPGQARTATITISYFDGTTLHERTDKYKVTFVRRTEVPIHTFAYGNTPYGMIMNAANIAAADKAAAKLAYDVNDRFTVSAYTPNKAAVAGEELTDYIYWPQAWQGTELAWPADWGERNLDRNDYALVVYVDQAFDDPGLQELRNSTGALVTGQTLSRSVEVTLLDPNGVSVTMPTNPADNTVADRFNGTETVEIDLGGLVMNSDGSASRTTVNALVNWETAEGKTIRPGIYALKYTFVDFDGASRSFTRPLVVLRHLGDVDANDIVEWQDSDYIRQRVVLPGMLADDIGVTNYTDDDKALYRYRICDVNNDSHINNIDANRIQNETALTDFYRPVDYIG